LVNNAGANFNHALRETPVDEYRQAFENNCLSAIRATTAVLPAMREARSGAIVNISSIYGQWGSSTSASYSVSKFALTGFSEALRQELVGSGIHVLSVFPGYIRTAMTSPFVQSGTLRSRLGQSPEALAREILRALKKNKQELYYPWYVPWALRLHRWFPAMADRLANRVKR
jgi:short-subunit dehydrogenase